MLPRPQLSLSLKRGGAHCDTKEIHSSNLTSYLVGIMFEVYIQLQERIQGRL